jgi:hypothetical protein
VPSSPREACGLINEWLDRKGEWLTSAFATFPPCRFRGIPPFRLHLLDSLC